jgi:hypothetical protein
MKVLTIKQPWASLIRENIKKIEFRSWKTNYRGVIYIHAGSSIEKNELPRFSSLNLEYPTSRIIAKATLVDCIEITPEVNKKIKSLNNIAYGNKDRTGYAWILESIEPIDNKKEIKGKLGLWNL